MSEPDAEPTDDASESFGDDGSGDIDRQTLLWAMAGDDRAFARLVQHYDPSLRSLVYPQVRQADLMDKVLISTYLQAYRALHRLKGAPDPGPWLSSIAAKACAAELRRQTQRHRVARRRDPAPLPPAGRPVDLSSRLDPVRSEGGEPSGPSVRPKPLTTVGAVNEPVPSPDEARDQTEIQKDTKDADGGEIGAGHPSAGVDVETGPGDPSDGPADADAPPAHHPDFWNRLGRRLLAEREIPARPAPTVDQFSAARRRARARAAQDPGGAGGQAPARPATVEELAQRARTPTRGERTSLVIRRAAVVMAVLSALGGVLFLAFRIGGNARPVNRSGMTTGRLADTVSATLDQSQFVTATFTHVELARPQSISTFRLTWSHDGSFRLKGINAPVDSSYDAATGTSRRSIPTSGADGVPAKQVETVGLAGGPPDPHAAMDPFFDHDLPAVLEAMHAKPDGTVSATSVQGRPVWQAEVDLGHDAPSSSSGGALGAANGGAVSARIRIDQQLLVPVELTVTSNARTIRFYTMGDLSLDQPPSLDAFTVPFGGGPVDRVDGHFVRTTLTDIGTRLPRSQPATPTYLPDGYELAEVAVLAGTGGRTGVLGRNPADSNVVSLTYRRGWDRLTVTTRANPGGGAQRWSDPFATTNPAPASEAVRIAGGRFRLTEAHRTIPSDAAPYLWGVMGDTVFTVSGDLSPAQLVKVTDSIQP